MRPHPYTAPKPGSAFARPRRPRRSPCIIKLTPHNPLSAHEDPLAALCTQIALAAFGTWLQRQKLFSRVMGNSNHGRYSQ